MIYLLSSLREIHGQYLVAAPHWPRLCNVFLKTGKILLRLRTLWCIWSRLFFIVRLLLPLTSKYIGPLRLCMNVVTYRVLRINWGWGSQAIHRIAPVPSTERNESETWSWKKTPHWIWFSGIWDIQHGVLCKFLFVKRSSSTFIPFSTRAAEFAMSWYPVTTSSFRFSYKKELRMSTNMNSCTIIKISQLVCNGLTVQTSHLILHTYNVVDRIGKTIMMATGVWAAFDNWFYMSGMSFRLSIILVTCSTWLRYEKHTAWSLSR